MTPINYNYWWELFLGMIQLRLHALDCKHGWNNKSAMYRKTIYVVNQDRFIKELNHEFK